MSIYERDKWYHFFVVLYVNARLLSDIVKLIANNYLPSLAGAIETVRNVLYIFCALYVAYLFLRYGIKKLDMLFWGGSALVFAASYLLCPDVSTIMSHVILVFFSRVMVGMFFFEHLTDYKKIIDMQKRFLIPTLIDAFLMFFMGQTEDYMAFSYNLIPFALFYLFYGLQYKKWLYGISGGAVFFITFVYGARGAVLCGSIAVLIYLIVTFLRGSKKVTIGRGLFFVLVIGAMITVYVSWDSIVSVLADSFGDSRTISMILSGDASSDSGRSEILQYVSEEIGKSPVLPKGILSDRIICSKFHGMSLSYMAYPHNYVYEIIYQFGLPLGAVFLLWNVNMLVKCFVRMPKKKKEYIIIAISFIPVAFIQLMVSSSYLISYFWGIAMGILLSPYNRYEFLQRIQDDAQNFEMRAEYE